MHSKSVAPMRRVSDFDRRRIEYRCKWHVIQALLDRYKFPFINIGHLMAVGAMLLLYLLISIARSRVHAQIRPPTTPPPLPPPIQNYSMAA